MIDTTDAFEPVGLRTRGEETTPALQNPAVAHSRDAWDRVFKLSMKRRQSQYEALGHARVAYCHAMPPLIGYENICNFIACIGYGILTNIIEESIASKLLYAAQVALTTIAPQSKTQRRDPA
jgi:hypothetical protein